jgi:hypothetical protein
MEKFCFGIPKRFPPRTQGREMKNPISILTSSISGIMMPHMRTTVTLEPDVARLLSERARQTRKSFKETLNAAVRSSLGRETDSSENREFTIEARPMQLKAGVDAGRLNSLLDDLDADAFIEKTRSENDITSPQ